MSLSELKDRLDWTLGLIATLLIAGNGFFVKRLVDKIDTLGIQVESLQIQVSIIDTRLNLVLKDAAVPITKSRLYFRKKI